MAADIVWSVFPFLLVLLIVAVIWSAARKKTEQASATFLPPENQASPEYTGPFAFFRRHFNGDYSLGRSYWINTLLVSLFAPALGLMLLPWLGANLPARYGSAAFLAITALGVAAWTWAVAGTWASANKHAQRGGKPGWAIAAKVMIVIGVVRTFVDISTITPILKEHTRVASGAQLGPDTVLEVRADGRSILLSGGINDGSADQLDKALQKAPSVATVVLSSNGGWIREGMMLADVIRKRGLDTYVEGVCQSACTIAFLAGKDRAAAPSAKLGFHASRSIGSGERKPTPGETEQLRAIYRRAGLPTPFISRALETPHDRMWFPSHEELLASGVFTRRSLGGETASLSTAIRSRDELEKEFKKTEVFSLLAQRYPADFQNLMNAAWSKLQQGATDAEVAGAARNSIMVIFPRFLPLGSDETLISFQALIAEQLAALRKRDYRACAELLFPSSQPMIIAGNLPPELVAKEMRFITTLLREADPARGIKPTPKEVERVAKTAISGMSAEQLSVFTDAAARQKASPELICDAAIKFISGLGSIPSAERGRAIRVLYSGVN